MLVKKKKKKIHLRKHQLTITFVISAVPQDHIRIVKGSFISLRADKLEKRRGR